MDEKVRFILEEIFALTLRGKSQLEVAKHINEKRYATPMIYYKTGRVYRIDDDPQWNVGSLSKMLTNQAYTGDMVQGIKSQFLAEGKKQKLVNRKDHIVVLNTHEPIISREDFEKVQIGRKKRYEESVFSSKEHDIKREPENRFQGLVFSYNGEELYRRYRFTSHKIRQLQYLYRNERFNGSIDQKESLFILEADLDKRIASDISKAINAITNKTSFSKRIRAKYDEAIEEGNRKSSQHDDLIKKEEVTLQKSYENYSLGKIDRNTYLLERDITQGRIETIEREKQAQEIKISNLKKDKRKALRRIKDIFSAKGLEKLPTELIASLVEKVIVYDKHEFEVIYKFNMESLKEESNE